MKKLKYGIATRLMNCCREIRLAGAFVKNVGDVINGFNTETNEHEKWEIIKINKSDHNKNVVQKIII